MITREYYGTTHSEGEFGGFRHVNITGRTTRILILAFCRRAI